MNRPDNILAYDEMDLKLGIKSSLPHVKSTLALAILLWECSGHPAELIYSAQNGGEIVMAKQLERWVVDYLADICNEEHISPDDLIAGLNQNQLFKSQIEALMVAFELVWKLAKVNFVDATKIASAERTGGVRFPKKLTYTVNIDIIHSVLRGNESAFLRVLLAWTGFDINTDQECEKTLIYLLTALSESAVFKLTDGSKDVIFNQNSLYRKLLETDDSVDVNGDKEAKGSLRILKSLLSDGMNPYLQYSNGTVSIASPNSEKIADYQKRVDTLLRLNATKVIGLEDLDSETEGISFDSLEESRINCGSNILLYGVPGSGKSYTIEHELCRNIKKENQFRVVFHPEYMYSDFVGQILPKVKKATDDDENSRDEVSYDFVPGPFTNVMEKAYKDPTNEYVLIIEELNRGNAPAIFGEIFQLLDRISENGAKDANLPVGTSSYSIFNKQIAERMYGDENKRVRIPSNLSIFATMNTSDQNVFTLDTAFQRRWQMRQVENSFERVDAKFGDAEILDTGVQWRKFCRVINNFILSGAAEMSSMEDKRLGVFFMLPEDLADRKLPFNKDEYIALCKKGYHALSSEEVSKLNSYNDSMDQIRKFPEKVIKYLWDDAFKFNTENVFNRNFHSLEDVISAFINASGSSRFDIFQDKIKDKLTGKDPNENV